MESSAVGLGVWPTIWNPATAFAQAGCSDDAAASSIRPQDRILVVVQLTGGNDGINTVVPFKHEEYAKSRKHLRIGSETVLKIDNEVGLHPSLRGFADMFEQGDLSIIQGVGYENPNRSHDVSMAIWQSARLSPQPQSDRGWLGRAMDVFENPYDDSADMILLGDESTPLALRSRKSTAISLESARDLRLEVPLTKKEISLKSNSSLLDHIRKVSNDASVAAHKLHGLSESSATSDASYPSTRLGQRLSAIANMIKSDFVAPVFYAIQSGYDTHSTQAPIHSRLLQELGDSLHAFHRDLAASRLSDRVISVCFSEFGRRIQENGSLGTDHGTAGPVFVAGASCKASLVGETPDLNELVDGDLKHTIDFRQVYSTVLREWLGLDTSRILPSDIEILPFL